jgi:isoamyl acetate esterase
MKKVFLFLLVTTSMAMVKPKKTTILFFGDSITQMGIDKGGYIDRIQNAVNEKKLQNRYVLLGAGIGGNKVYDLYLRLEDDVLGKKPNVVVIWVGVNDVWHKTSGTGTDLDKYEKFYVALIKKMQAKKIQLVLTTPSAIGEKYDGSNPQDKDLDIYSDVIRRLAVEYKCKLVDLRKIFMSYEKENNTGNKDSGILTTDRVHLNDKGNQLVADEMWKALM